MAYRHNILAEWGAFSRDGNRVGWVRRMGFSPPSRMVLSYLISIPPRMTGKIFLHHPRPLGPRETPKGEAGQGWGKAR